jgi:hypothetical protein
VQRPRDQIGERTATSTIIALGSFRSRLCPAGRTLLLASAGSFALFGCSTLPPSSSTQDLETAVARLSAGDPDSPATLNARVALAELWVDDSTPGDCRQRVSQATSQLDAVRASPATAVLFPDGWARVSDADYRIHRLSAACASEAQERNRELLAMVDAARKTVELYRNALDYPSVAAMQFNVSVGEEMLGNRSAAVEALESAIETDRRFGLRDDASENYERLLRLRDEPADGARIAALMHDFPGRSATLRFAWSDRNDLVSFQSARRRLANAAVFESHVRATLRCTVRKNQDHWVLSRKVTAASDDPGVWPLVSSLQGLEDGVFTPPLMEFPDVEVSAAGDLQRVDALDEVAARLSSEAQAAVRAHSPQGESSAQLVERGLEAVRAAYAPHVIEAQTIQAYSLETAMWMGATLQQGVWYDTTARLILPEMPNVALMHRLRFAYTRPVPCGPTAADETCIELVIHAAPDPVAINALIESYRFKEKQPLQYESETDLRLVVDPATLHPYSHETRRYWYAAIRQGQRLERRLESEHRSWSATSEDQADIR